MPLQYIFIIMKPNRYKANQEQPQPKAALSQRTPFHPQAQERATLTTLIANFKLTDIYTLSCNKKLSLYISSPFQNNHLPKPTLPFKAKTRKQTLQQLLSRYEANPQMAYVFKAQQNQINSQDFTQNAVESNKNYISLCKTASEGQLSSNRAQKDSNRKQISEKFESASKTQSNSKRMSKDGSRFGFEERHNMFTVEEVKQSQQSDVQQSLKENTHSENRKSNYNFSHVQFNYNKVSENKQNNLPVQMDKKVCSEITKQENPISSERDPLQPISNTYKKPSNFPTPEQSNPHTATNAHNLQGRQTINNSQKGSFAAEIRRGLIQNDSYQPCQAASLKVAGDRQIEKQLNNKMSQNQGSHISELSSILSTGQQGINSRTQINSLKNDIEMIDQECYTETTKRSDSKNKAFVKKENQQYQTGVTRQEQKVEKMNLNAIAQQREEEVNDNIVITEKKDSKQPEFLVHYNLRFLERKNAVTEVMRLSPLRFRPKQQLNQTTKPQSLLRDPECKKN